MTKQLEINYIMIIEIYHFKEYVDQWKDEVNSLPTIPDKDHGRRKDDPKINETQEE